MTLRTTIILGLLGSLCLAQGSWAATLVFQLSQLVGVPTTGDIVPFQLGQTFSTIEDISLEIEGTHVQGSGVFFAKFAATSETFVLIPLSNPGQSIVADGTFHGLEGADLTFLLDGEDALVVGLAPIRNINTGTVTDLLVVDLTQASLSVTGTPNSTSEAPIPEPNAASLFTLGAAIFRYALPSRWARRTRSPDS